MLLGGSGRWGGVSWGCFDIVMPDLSLVFRGLGFRAWAWGLGLRLARAWGLVWG